MALKKYSDEQIQKMSMIELANIVLADEKKEMNFIDLFHKVADLKDFTQAQRDDLLSRFYTDLNVDGRFTTLGSNVWGLKRWYPVDQTSEKALAESRKRDLEEEEYLDEELEDEALEEEEDEDALYEDYDDLDYSVEDE
ncbi:DNA-directed RNA polymerase subunit delta [Pseudogracilibacillus auburnensis]|uniref:Probable DNA-directed RNA polymerase subunit delta n=1 Tax=Pseudogracilibacillus auburnensis TaxID=1494959 RepID=A0A2V3WEX5_9BACI|nr:DNA-directed RNA polymerase subunit delta [Pseudogracilibacillus auburnensis]MBO1002075.1 DNA-directed RNA polymerase subunit delta [Pseudogracilibacillus auburnensis]PXW87399.1 DNA-directed RNA polymerase subunit delta [Pseudogracilibacillus auburnensis]